MLPFASLLRTSCHVATATDPSAAAATSDIGSDSVSKQTNASARVKIGARLPPSPKAAPFAAPASLSEASLPIAARGGDDRPQGGHQVASLSSAAVLSERWSHFCRFSRDPLSELVAVDGVEKEKTATEGESHEAAAISAA